MSPDSIQVFDIRKEMVKALLRNTIETYPPEWRLIQEPLQNAIDSYLDDSGKPIDMKGEPQMVTLELYVGSNLVKIKDNGRGVPVDRYGDFLLLGGGTKGSIPDAEIKKLLKGSQGVGIKSSVFTSEYFKIDTVNGMTKWQLELPNFSNYTDPSFKGVVGKPLVEQTQDHTGTEITIRLSGYSVWDFITERIDDFFKTVEIDNLKIDEDGKIDTEDNRPMSPLDPMKILMRYFKKESYAGCVSRVLDLSDKLDEVRFQLKVICDFPIDKQDAYDISGIRPFKSGKTYQEDGRVEYLNYAEIINQLPPKQRPRIISDYKTLLEMGTKYNTPTIFYQVLKKSDIELLIGQVRKRKSTDPPSPEPNILIASPEKLQKHKKVLGKVNGAILFIAPRAFLRNPLAHRSTVCLSVNGLPTDITLDITGAELGYLPATHLVLDVQETLGYGKRNLPPRSKGAYNNLGKDLWRNLHKLAKSIVSEEGDQDLSVVGKLFKKPQEKSKVFPRGQPERRICMDYLGRITPPEMEEDLIASYFHMVGRGELKKYKWIRLNDNTVYDALAYSPDLPESDEAEEKMLTVEFKFSLEELCKSDEERKQRFEDIHLAIVWKVGDNENLPADYELLPKEADTGFMEYLPDVNYRVKHVRRSVQIICLEDIYNEILEREKK